MFLWLKFLREEGNFNIMTNDTMTTNADATTVTQYFYSEMRIIGGFLGELDLAINEFLVAHRKYDECHGKLEKKGFFQLNPVNRRAARRRLSIDEHMAWGVAQNRCNLAANRYFGAAAGYRSLADDFPEFEIKLPLPLNKRFEVAEKIFDDPKNGYGAF
jgi:hypothetical protein